MNHELFVEDPEIEKREMKLQQIVIGHKSVFAGKTIAESGIRNRYNCMVVGLEKGLESLSPVTPTHRLNGGDIIWIVGEKDDIETIVQQL